MYFIIFSIAIHDDRLHRLVDNGYLILCIDVFAMTFSMFFQNFENVAIHPTQTVTGCLQYVLSSATSTLSQNHLSPILDHIPTACTRYHKLSQRKNKDFTGKTTFKKIIEKALLLVVSAGRNLTRNYMLIVGRILR